MSKEKDYIFQYFRIEKMEKKSKNKNKNKYVKHKEQRKKVHAPRVKKADVLKAKIADLKSRHLDQSNY